MPELGSFCNAICNGSRKTDCDRSDPLRRVHASLYGFSVRLVISRRDRSDPLRHKYLPTDQKVGGSNPSERAKSAGHRLADPGLIFGSAKFGTRVGTDLADSHPTGGPISSRFIYRTVPPAHEHHSTWSSGTGAGGAHVACARAGSTMAIALAGVAAPRAANRRCGRDRDTGAAKLVGRGDPGVERLESPVDTSELIRLPPHCLTPSRGLLRTGRLTVMINAPIRCAGLGSPCGRELGDEPC